MFSTFELAEASITDLSYLNTQECWTYDAEDVYIISDVPIIDGDNDVIVSCEYWGYYTYEITAQGDYNAEYPTDPTEGLEEVEEILGCTDPAATNYDATANTDDGSCIDPDPMEGYEDLPDTSAIVNFACGDINLCAESGYGVDSAALNLYLSEGSTANEINNALGFECFDPITCEVLYEAPVPIVGEIQSSSQAQNLLIACFPPDPTTGAMNSELMYYFPQINVQPYPIMWDDFNALIGFNCLNSNAEVATLT